MNELAVADKGADWRRLTALVLDSVRPRGRASLGRRVAAWRVALEALGLGPSISFRKRRCVIRQTTLSRSYG
jgi:hypothetical protein